MYPHKQPRRVQVRQMSNMRDPSSLPAQRSLDLLTGGAPLTATGRLPNVPVGPVPIPQPGRRSQAPQPARQPNTTFPQLGGGQAIARLIQFSTFLSLEGQDDAAEPRSRLGWWQNGVEKFFADKGFLRLTLWKDGLRQEAKPFDVGKPVLPRFFLVTTQSGVKSMQLALDGARERLVTVDHAVVECVQAYWFYRYSNGYTVVLRGPLTVHILAENVGNAEQPDYHCKISEFNFDAKNIEKHLAVEDIQGVRLSLDPPPNAADDEMQYDEPRIHFSRAHIPGEPVNAFGIPQATMRCLELSESVTTMSDLISFAQSNDLGPAEALKAYASKLGEAHRNRSYGNPFFPNNQGLPFQVNPLPGVPPPPPPESSTFSFVPNSMPAGNIRASMISSLVPPPTQNASSPAPGTPLSTPRPGSISAAGSPDKQPRMSMSPMQMNMNAPQMQMLGTPLMSPAITVSGGQPVPPRSSPALTNGNIPPQSQPLTRRGPTPVSTPGPNPTPSPAMSGITLSLNGSGQGQGGGGGSMLPGGTAPSPLQSQSLSLKRKQAPGDLNFDQGMHVQRTPPMGMSGVPGMAGMPMNMPMPTNMGGMNMGMPMGNMSMGMPMGMSMGMAMTGGPPVQQSPVMGMMGSPAMRPRSVVGMQPQPTPQPQQGTPQMQATQLQANTRKRGRTGVGPG